MRQIFAALFVVSFGLATLPLTAQQRTPKYEIALGYSYSRAQVPDSSSRANMHGLLIDGTRNLNRWVGVQAEFGTHYHCISGCWSPWGERIVNPDERNDSLSFMVGPKFTLSRARWSPWLHCIAGVSRTTYDSIFGDHMSHSGFATAFGGGLEFGSSSVTFRVIQFDYVRLSGPTGTYDNPRIGAGVVLRLGRLVR